MQGHVTLCPHCAARDERPILCDRCGWRWYANPSPAAGTLVERPAADGDPSVLLLRRAVDPGIGAWELPAGYLEAGESAEEAALRETREETGLDVQLLGVVGVYTSRAANAISTIYLARPLDPGRARLRVERSCLGSAPRGRRLAAAHGVRPHGHRARRLGGRDPRRAARLVAGSR